MRQNPQKVAARHVQGLIVENFAHLKLEKPRLVQDSPIPLNFMDTDCWAVEKAEHRYWLARDLERGQLSVPLIIWVMLNPSRARGVGIGDPTQRRCDGFTARLNTYRYGIVNLFARSTPYPKDLFDWGYDDAVGPHNDEVLDRVFREAKRRQIPVIAAWGKPSKLSRLDFGYVAVRMMEVADLARHLDVPLYCLDTTEDNWPRHPLMLGYDKAILKPWSLNL